MYILLLVTLVHERGFSAHGGGFLPWSVGKWSWVLMMLIVVVVIVGDASSVSWHLICETGTLGDPLAGVRCSDPKSLLRPQVPAARPGFLRVRLGGHDIEALEVPARAVMRHGGGVVAYLKQPYASVTAPGPAGGRP